MTLDTLESTTLPLNRGMSPLPQSSYASTLLVAGLCQSKAKTSNVASVATEPSPTGENCPASLAPKRLCSLYTSTHPLHPLRLQAANTRTQDSPTLTWLCRTLLSPLGKENKIACWYLIGFGCFSQRTLFPLKMTTISERFHVPILQLFFIQPPASCPRQLLISLSLQD